MENFYTTIASLAFATVSLVGAFDFQRRLKGRQQDTFVANHVFSMGVGIIFLSLAPLIMTTDPLKVFLLYTIHLAGITMLVVTLISTLWGKVKTEYPVIFWLLFTSTFSFIAISTMLTLYLGYFLFYNLLLMWYFIVLFCRAWFLVHFISSDTPKSD